MILDVELVVEGGGPPVQCADEILAATGSKGQCQDIRGGEIGGKVNKALGGLVCSEAKADRVVSVTRVYDKVVGQIVGKVGEGRLENGRNGFRNILGERSRIGIILRNTVTCLNVVEREDNWLQFEVNTCFEPVLPGDWDPFIVGEESICGSEVVGCGESKVCGLTNGREDVEVGEGCEDEDKDNGFYGGKRSARCQGSGDGTHCLGDLARTIRVSTLESAEGPATDRDRRPLRWTAGGRTSVRTTWATMATATARSAWVLCEQGETGNGEVVRPDIYCPMVLCNRQERKP